MTVLSLRLKSSEVVVIMMLCLLGVHMYEYQSKRRMVPLYRKTDWDALKNICRLYRALYCLWSVNKWLFVV